MKLRAVSRNAVLRNAVLRNAVLRNAVLRNAVLRNAVLRNAVVTALVPGLAGVILAATLAAAPAAVAASNGDSTIGDSIIGDSIIGDSIIGGVTVLAGCDNHPGVPDWFYPTLQRAAENPNDAVPNSWAESDRGVAMMKIICNESGFDVGALNPAGPYYGLGQLGRPAIDASGVRFACYWFVENDCDHLRRYYQCLAALRYANQRYGGPLAAWAHWQNHGWW